MTSKILYVLLTWPIGVYLIASVIKVGFQLEPYALAVHEMLVIVVLSALMVSSLLYARRTEVSGYSAGMKLWHMAMMIFAVLLNLSFLVTPILQYR